MRSATPLLVLGALLLVSAPVAHSAPGDVFVPAHRTRDGQYVPANVPPLSAGTHSARRPARGAVAQRQSGAKLAPPLLVEAREVRR